MNNSNPPSNPQSLTQTHTQVIRLLKGKYTVRTVSAVVLKKEKDKDGMGHQGGAVQWLSKAPLIFP